MGEEIGVKKFEVKTIEVSNCVDKHHAMKHFGVTSCDVTDITDSALRELFEIKQPHLKDKFKEVDYQNFLKNQKINPKAYGVWVHYPWLNKIMKIPQKSHLRDLRTARNKLLITDNEQSILLRKTILIAGMSVGSNVLSSMLHAGIGGIYVLSDMDVLEITNLNRINTGITSVGQTKVRVAAQTALELDPYLDIYLMEEGIQKRTIAEIAKMGKLDLIVDEVDDIEAKVALRELAKSKGVPLTMATDNSDGAIIDVERYDTDNTTKFFNGRIPAGILDDMAAGSIAREEAGALIGKYFVGIDLVDNRLIESLLEVRKTIPSWPQLGTAAALSGVLSSFCSKVILLGGKLKSDRYVCDYDKEFASVFSSKDYINDRKILVKRLSK